MNYSLFQRFGMKLFGIKRLTETKYAILEADNKKISENLASVKAELGLANSKIEELESEKRNKVTKQQVAEKLLEEGEKIHKEEIGKLFSLGALYRMIYGIKLKPGESEFGRRSKFGKRFEFADKDDENSFVFGDINVSEKGFFVITDKDKRIVAQFPVPQGMFAKPSSLLNQIRRGRILLGIDKDGRYIPEFDEVEIELPVWNETLQEYEDAEVLRVNARKTIIELKDSLREQEDKNEKYEIIIDSAKRDIRDLKRKSDKYRSEIKIYESDISRLEEDNKNIKSKSSYMQSRILELQEVAAMKEGLAEKFENCLNEVLVKLENVAGKTAKDKALSEFKDIMDFLQMQKELRDGKAK